jgi:hypothetical protein
MGKNSVGRWTINHSSNEFLLMLFFNIAGRGRTFTGIFEIMGGKGLWRK